MDTFSFSNWINKDLQRFIQIHQLITVFLSTFCINRLLLVSLSSGFRYKSVMDKKDMKPISRFCLSNATKFIRISYCGLINVHIPQLDFMPTGFGVTFSPARYSSTPYVQIKTLSPIPVYPLGCRVHRLMYGGKWWRVRMLHRFNCAYILILESYMIKKSENH